MGFTTCTSTCKSDSCVLPATWLVHSNSIKSISRGTTPKVSSKVSEVLSEQKSSS